MLKKTDTILHDCLLKKGLLSREILDSLLQETGASGDNLHKIIIQRGLLPEKEILSLLAEKLKFAFVDLKQISVDKTVLDKVPLKVASYYKFVPLSIKGRSLTIAVSYPLEIKTQDEIRTQLGYSIEVVLACESDIVEGFRKYYGQIADTLGQMVSQVSQAPSLTRQAEQEKIEDIEKLAEDASIIKLVNQILVEGWKRRATDIHIEPFREGVSLRYRVDGVMYDAKVPPEIRNFLNAIISRIKIMSNLNIVERRLPQDGRAVVKIQEHTLDLRISTIPTQFGESLVIRILPTSMLFSLEKLGLSKKDLKVFENLLQKPHGVIFVTGPTGSGKTTTLYACLSRLNSRERKIITIEDPIEYEFSGITQIQVMPEIGLDFARGLRSILRHDPDVIMVGEVRDLETAEISIRVALTGHLILSTLHTNDAASGIARLIDIGLEPYLVASSVEAFVAQRLVRVLCNDCKYEDKNASRELKEMIMKDLGLRSLDEVKIFRAKGCPSCNNMGFWGRSAIYEILLADEAIKNLIFKKAPAGQIKNTAVSRGMRTLRQDGWQKVIAGITTPEEIIKVTSIQAVKDVDFTGMEREAAVSNVTVREDNRVFDRLKEAVNIRYKIFDSQEELVKGGFKPEKFSATKDISAGGLLFVSPESLPVGSVVELTIELPDGHEPLVCLARVVRVEAAGKDKDYDIGVCFLDITGAQRTRLNKYVEREG